MLLHETAKAREVCRHTRDAHHCAFGCKRMDKGGAADSLNPHIHMVEKKPCFLVADCYSPPHMV